MMVGEGRNDGGWSCVLQYALSLSRVDIVVCKIERMSMSFVFKLFPI